MDASENAVASATANQSGERRSKETMAVRIRIVARDRNRTAKAAAKTKPQVFRRDGNNWYRNRSPRIGAYLSRGTLGKLSKPVRNSLNSSISPARLTRASRRSTDAPTFHRVDRIIYEPIRINPMATINCTTKYQTEIYNWSGEE